MILTASPFRRCVRAFAAAALALAATAAQADIATGVAWLKAREDAAGVHRASDLANAADTNAEAYATVAALSRSAEFAQLVAVVQTQRDETLLSLARLANNRIALGQSGATELSQALTYQQADGGIPPVPGTQSEPLATAVLVAALDRAGRGTQTESARAIGYLIAAQQPNGGWLSAPGNTPSVFATAQIARVLVEFRNRFDLTAPLGRATTFLQNARTPANLFGSAFETGLALDALVALRVDRATLAPVATALAALQAGSGSFDDDAYVTAIALRALWQYEQPVIDPQRAGLTGRVLSADTELPINGATLTLTGAGSATLVSNDLGRLQSTTLAGGSYSASLAFPGMRTVEFQMTLVDGRTLDLGDIRMYQGTSPAGDFALIRGTVTSRETGAPIGGAVVRIDAPANQATTGGDGRYQFLQVPPGTVNISVGATGFSSRSAVVAVQAQQIIEFSPALEPVTQPQTGATIRGRVVHGQTGQPLGGVTVAVIAGATPASTQTDGAGNYSLQSEPGTLVTIRASLTDFDPVTISAPLVENEVLPFSPRLYPTGTTPSDANRAEIKGVVVNQANRQPIAGALIVVSDPSGQRSVTSAGDGAFSVTGIAGPVTRLAFSADAFDPATLAVSIQPLEVRDVGQVGLKPTAISFYFPDLAIVASSLSTTDPDSFALDSRFTLEIANRGTSSTTQDFTVIAFVDANGNNAFDPAVEPQIGRVRVDQDLPIAGSAEVDIAVGAQLTFRDAPVAFWVDAENEIPEQVENNNVASSLLGCRVTPSYVSQGNVYEYWRWNGLAANPQINSLNATPSVAQLSDDNGDGVVNEYDIPDVIFVAGQRNSSNPSATALVALDGKTGRELWTRTDFRLSQFSSPAVGDLDNDGVAEIVVVTGYRTELIAFENTGALKWRRPLDGPGIPVPIFPPPPHVYDLPIIANLEGDNEAEVIFGREAFRGLNGEQLWEGEFDAGGDGGKPRTSPLAKAHGIASIAADVDLDGRMEVLAGRTLYDFEGRTIWHRGDIMDRPFEDAVHTPMNHSGYTAVGNFDLDDFAEIVLVVDNEMWLLEHTGQTIWGPKKSPDGTGMGAPTIADIDNDGLPEIMVSSTGDSSTNARVGRLTVFESDGTVKKTFDIRDGSGVTSASVFDFENDGILELVHMDEKDFRILDAQTLVPLFETANSSRTVYEYPVVADIDGDKQAEVIITGYDDDLALRTPGIRVFKARNGAWADAGSVWGSHAFHVDDINEDSTVPLLETPSWLTHNTYRVQRSPRPDPLGMPDFSVGDLRLIDQGPGLDPVVQVRVGNAGPVDAHEPPWIGVYRGDPASGGVLLRETRLDTLRPARFQIVNLGTVPISGSGDLYAVVDQRARATECRETNNQRRVPFTATNGRGDLQLSTDRISYRPGDVVTLTAAVANQGAIPADYTVAWQIRDAQGRTAATLDALTFTAVPAAQSSAQNRPWPSDGVLAGTYTLSGQLRNEQGSVIDTATATFAIAGDVSGPAGAIRLTTPRATYAPGEPVALDYRAQNLSSSEQIRLPEVVVAITGPGGFSQQRAIALDDLFANAYVDGRVGVDGAEAAGVYTATARLRSRLNGFEYATASTTFERVLDTSANVQGFVDVSLATLVRGQPQTCLFTVRNRGVETLLAMPLRKRVVALDSGAVMFEQAFASDLAPGADYVASETLPTAAYTPGDHACLIEIRQADGTWRILDSEPFAVTAPAAAAIVVSPTSGLVTTEAGQTAQFTVALASRPTADVTIPLTVSDASELRLPAASVTITAATWDVPHTVTVVGVDDTLVDGDQVAQVLLGAAQSADTDYAGLDGADVDVTNRDDDSVRIDVAPTSAATSENGTAASFVVQVNTAPSAPVTIALQNPDAGEWQVAPVTLTFDAANWQSAQSVTVTGVDDGDFDGTQTGTLVLAAAQSADPRYNGLDPADVALSNADNEQAAIAVDPTAVLTSEAGQAGAFTVRLNRAPGAAVVIPVGPVDASEWQVLATAVRLDAANWASGQTVAVTPVDDDQVDGDQTGVLVLGPAQSADAQFNGLDAADVALTNLDDDAAQILVTPTSGLIVDENGATATFTVALTTAPTAPVTIDVASGDATEFVVAPAQLTFTPQDWSTRTVTVTGVDDADVDGNIVGALQVAAAVSADARYDGVDPPNVAATNIDNETVQVVVSPDGSVETDESGTQATIEVRLSTAPTQPVTIALTNPDTGEWTLGRAALEFPAGSTAPQRVVVTGVDDFELDGDVTGVVALAPIVSADARYNGLDPRDVPALNRDDDAPAQVTVTPAGGIETRESGTSATFVLRLSTAPSADVVIALTNPDATEWALDRTDVRFTAADWDTPQTVVVTGQDDIEIDGDISAAIVLAPIVSQDARYHGLDPADVPAVNRDDDAVAQVSVSPAGTAQTSETGTSVAISVQVGTQPQSDVVIALTNPDPTEWSLDRTEIRIRPSDWQAAHGFVITGVDDAVIDGDVTGTVVLAPIASADPRFAGVDPADVPAINRDDDVPAAAALLVTGNDLDVSESGDGGRLQVVLNRAPSADVRVAVVSADPNEVAVAPAQLVFTPANALKPQTVTLAGVDDAVADGDRSVNLAIRVTASADAAFAALPPQNVVAVNRDNDVASVALALQGPAQIAEGQSTDLRLAFGSQPQAPLTITFVAAIAAPGQLGDMTYALEPQTATLSPQQWQAGVPLRLSTVDDGRRSGDRTIDVRVLAIAGADPAYAALTGNTVSVLVRDRGAAAAVPVPAASRALLAMLTFALMMLGLAAAWRGRGRNA